MVRFYFKNCNVFVRDITQVKESKKEKEKEKRKRKREKEKENGAMPMCFYISCLLRHENAVTGVGRLSFCIYLGGYEMAGSGSNHPIPPERRDSISLFALLVVAAVTFQAAVNPSGGVWQDTNDNHYAGKAIIASNPSAYKAFIFCNSVTFSSSALVIFFLVFHSPFFLVTWMALLAMTATYLVSVDSVRPTEINSQPFTYVGVFLPYLVSSVVRLGGRKQYVPQVQRQGNNI